MCLLVCTQTIRDGVGQDNKEGFESLQQGS